MGRPVQRAARGAAQPADAGSRRDGAEGGAAQHAAAARRRQAAHRPPAALHAVRGAARLAPAEHYGELSGGGWEGHGVERGPLGKRLIVTRLVM